MDEQGRIEQQEAQRQIDMVACEAGAHEREELNRRAGGAETVRRDTAMSIDETAANIRRNINELVAQRNDLLAACKTAAKAMKDIRAQRDELLGVLREARACMSIDGTYGKMRPQQKLVVLNRINKAIARVEGKK